MKSHISHPIGGNTDLLDLKNRHNLAAFRVRMIPHIERQIQVWEPIDYRGFDAPTSLRRTAGLLRLRDELLVLERELQGLQACRKQAC